jgi:glycine/D-amino acid oxidase-like deaminating enzyme
MYVKQAVDLAIASGYHAEYWHDHAKILEVIPDLNLDGVLGAGWCPDDGFFDATMLANTLARRARSAGTRIMTSTKVESITTEDGRVTGVTTSQGDTELDVLIDATGPWARTTASLVGLDLPLWHTKAEVFILVPAAGLGYPFPVLKYPRFYARKDKDNVFICKAHMTMDLSDETHAGIWDPDDLPMIGGTDAYFWEFLTDELLNVYPRLLESSIGNEWVGYRAEPADFLPILGDTPVEGYMLAAGAGGNGVIEAPTIGRDMARFVMTGEKSWYLDRLPLSRFANIDKVLAEAQASKLQR